MSSSLLDRLRANNAAVATVSAAYRDRENNEHTVNISDTTATYWFGHEQIATNAIIQPNLKCIPLTNTDTPVIAFVTAPGDFNQFAPLVIKYVVEKSFSNGDTQVAKYITAWHCAQTNDVFTTESGTRPADEQPWEPPTANLALPPLTHTPIYDGGVIKLKTNETDKYIEVQVRGLSSREEIEAIRRTNAAQGLIHITERITSLVRDLNFLQGNARSLVTQLQREQDPISVDYAEHSAANSLRATFTAVDQAVKASHNIESVAQIGATTLGTVVDVQGGRSPRNASGRPSDSKYIIVADHSKDDKRFLALHKDIFAKEENERKNIALKLVKGARVRFAFEEYQERDSAPIKAEKFHKARTLTYLP